MKKLIFYSITIIILGCSKKVSNDNILLISNKKIENILVSFVKENKCNNCIYEVYVDKQDPHIYKLLLYKGIESLTEKENIYNNQIPIGSTKVLNFKYDIYSGAEHYFRHTNDSDNKKYKKSIIDINLKKDYKLWIVKDSFDIISIEKKNYAYPFMTLPKNVETEFKIPR